MKNIILLIVALLIVLAIVRKWPKRDRSELEKQAQKYERAIDSLNFVYRTLSRRDSIMTARIADLADSVEWMASKADIFKAKYNDLKNRPVKHLSDPQLDSALQSIR